MPIKIAINGFGRMGRLTLRNVFGDSEIDVVAINSRGTTPFYAHLLKYDSSYGIWNKQVSAPDEKTIEVDGKKIKFFHELTPDKLPWKELDVDVVVESTGVFRNREESEKHIISGAKKVVITAPAKREDITLVPGVNLDQYDYEKHNIISSASCTSNCLAPIV